MSGSYNQIPNTPYYAPVQPQEYYNVPPQYVVVAPQQQQLNVGVAPKKDMSNDSISALILFITGFFVCLTWPICYCFYRNSTDPTAKALAKVSLVITITSVVLTVLAIGTYFALLALILYGLQSSEYYSHNYDD